MLYHCTRNWRANYSGSLAASSGLHEGTFPSYMLHNHSRDRLEENDQACGMMVSYVYSSKIWYEVVPSFREI